MRLYRLPTPGSIDNLTMIEADIPRPARGQVLVRMRAASLNYRDLVIADGRYSRGSPKPDLTPLSDGAGEVVEVGPEVNRVRIGDRVCPIFMQSWIGGESGPDDAASSLGGAVDGVLAEYALFDQQGLVLIPDHLSFAEAATLPCAALTAWNALYGQRPLRVGQTVLVLGTGGVSMFALQFAHAAGARVIGTSSSDKKLEKAHELGLSDGVNYREYPEGDVRVRALTGGLGVDHVVEVGGAGTLPRSVAATRRNGSVHLIGVLTGGQIDPAVILRSVITVRGVNVGSRQMFESMNQAIALHAIRPVIDRSFSFEHAIDAYRHLQGASHMGKLVIEID